MKKLLKFTIVAVAATFLILQVNAVLAVPPEHANDGGRGFGTLWYDGEQVGTFVPSGKPLKNPGTDPLYVFPNGEQSSVTQFAPGDPEYRGGHWAVYFVTWETMPYLLTSADAVKAAETAGDITIERMPEADVLCPVLPLK